LHTVKEHEQRRKTEFWKIDTWLQLMTMRKGSPLSSGQVVAEGGQVVLQPISVKNLEVYLKDHLHWRSLRLKNAVLTYVCLDSLRSMATNWVNCVDCRFAQGDSKASTILANVAGT
jgi:hypothetical protein